MAVQRKRNIAGYYDDHGRFRPIRSPQYVGAGQSKRRATKRDKRKYSRAKAGDLGKRRQSFALEDVFDKAARQHREQREKDERQKARILREIERDVTAGGSHMSGGSAQTLMQFVRGKGGIKPDKESIKAGSYGELESLTYKESGKRGLVSTSARHGIDGMFQAAREAGFDLGDTWDLIDRLDQEARTGEAMYSTHGVLDYRDNPKMKAKAKTANPKSDLYVSQLGRRKFGVFLKTYLLKTFTTKAGAESYKRSVQSRRKNPVQKKPKFKIGDKVYSYWNKTSPASIGQMSYQEFDNPKDNFWNYALNHPTLGRRWVAEHSLAKTKSAKVIKNPSAARVAKAAISIFDNDLDLDVDIKDVRRLQKGQKLLRKPAAKKAPARRKAVARKPAAKRRKNPDAISTFAAGANGILAALQIKSLLASRKRRKSSGKTTAKRKKRVSNPVKVKLYKFVAGQKVATRSIGNHDVIYRGRIISRTPKMVTFDAGDGVKKAKIQVWGDEEVFYPFGRYSMAPVFSAKDAILKRINPAGGVWLLTVYYKNGKVRSVHVTDGKKRYGKFRSAAAARKFAKDNGIKLVANPAGGNGKTAAAGSAKKKNPVRSTRGKTAAARSTTRKNPVAKKPAVKRNAVKVPVRRTYEMFQGRPATQAKALPVSKHAPARLDQLGDLIELKLSDGRIIKPNPKRFKLAAAGGKLWIVGGKFAKANPAGGANELNPIAQIEHVVYGTFKPHHGDNNYTHYIHKLGEDTGHVPTLAVDREGFPVIRGGRYKIEARGIVN